MKFFIVTVFMTISLVLVVLGGFHICSNTAQLWVNIGKAEFSFGAAIGAFCLAHLSEPDHG